MDTEERPHREGKQPMKEDEDQGNKAKKPPLTCRSPSPDPGDGDDGGDDDGEDDDEEEDDKTFDVTQIEREEEERVQWEVYNHLRGVKHTAVVNTQRAFSAAAKDIQYSIFDKMQAEGQEAEKHLDDPSYQENAV